MPRAGELRESITFQSREEVDDGYGNQVSGDWADQFTVAANFKPLRGTETVMAARLAGSQPYVVTVRQSELTRQVRPEWRFIDARNTGREFNIRAIHDPDGRNAWFEILAVEGVAT